MSEFQLTLREGKRNIKFEEQSMRSKETSFQRKTSKSVFHRTDESSKIVAPSANRRFEFDPPDILDLENIKKLDELYEMNDSEVDMVEDEMRHFSV